MSRICQPCTEVQFLSKLGSVIFFCTRPPPGLLPVLGPLGSGTDGRCHTLAKPCLAALGLVLILGRTSDIVKALLPPAPCNLNCDKVFPLLSDQHTIPKQDSNPPKQSEDYYQSKPLPPSHHGRVC